MLALTNEQQELATKYFPKIPKLINSLHLYDKKYIDDIESSAMLALVIAARDYKKEKCRDFIPFLKQVILRRVCDDVWRKKDINRMLTGIDFDILEESSENDFETILDFLNEKEKRIIKYYFVEEKKLREIGKILNCSHSTIFYLKEMALKKLKKRVSNA